ncbi:MAG: serine/threonine protein kinase [Polyangiaceae bacterium]|nr:serine/threonine protein kinase [Polyangiaceae bacterium]
MSFGPYLLVERIGLGARSEVHRAKRHTDRGDEWFAVKRALAGAVHDLETQSTLFAEAELLSKLDHPGIVRVRDFGSMQGVAFVAYDLVDGVDLERLLTLSKERDRPLPLAASLTIALRVAEALEYVHSARGGGEPIVHRDVGPSNILVARDGSVRLADFGIAKVPGRNSTTGVGEIKGTVRYMSPEQVRGADLDPRSDLYGLGAVVLEMTSGKPPFEGLRPVDVLQALAQGRRLDPDQHAPSLPEPLRAFLRKVLAPEPAERYDTSTKVLDALRGLVQGSGVRVGEDAVAHVVGELFPARAQDKTFEESRDMADEKGGSDLDVFEGLAKKSQRPSSLPIPASAPPVSQKPSSLPAPVPPPPSLRAGAKTTLLGVPPPALPPPTGATSTPLPVAPPSIKPTTKTLVGAQPPPPPPSAVAPPALPPHPSAAGALPPGPSVAGALPPPPPAKNPSAPPVPPPLSKPPNTLVAAVPPPPKPPPSIGSAVGIPSKPAPAAEAKDDGDEKTPPTGSSIPKKEGKEGASVDMDWEEDEESTHVFEKRKHAMNKAQGPRPAAGAPAEAGSRVGQAATLLMSSGSSAAPRSVPPPPAIPVAKTIINEPMPVAPPVAAIAAPTSVRKPSDEPTIVRPREGSSGRLGAILGGLALVAVVGLIVYMAWPRKGALQITVKASSGQALGKTEIFVDGSKRCDVSPCLVSDLDAGPRSVKVMINGVSVAEQTAEVKPGRDNPVAISVDMPGEKPAPTSQPVASATATASSTASAVVSEGTGFKLSGPSGVKVLLDGKDKGSLGSGVLSFTDLAPGEHTLKLEGGDNYKTIEKKITVAKDKVEDLGEHKPPVIKGILTVELKTEGATVELSGTRDGKKFEKKVNADQLKKLGVPTEESWKITVTKKGHDDFVQDLKFDDGVAEKTLTIELVEKGKTPPPPPPVSTGPITTAKPPPTATATTSATAASGTGTLSMNSIPISNVILDGVPIGKTPIGGRSVSAGKHTVTFRHPEKGTKSVTVNVPSGGKANASVKFE